MSKKSKDILVIGLGRFGMAIVNTLLERNQKITVVDNNEEKVNNIASRCEYAKVCDTKNEEVLKQLGVTNFDHVVVAIGSSIESSIITTLLLKDLGVENITVKASNKQHYQALLKLGVPETNVIMPESEMGEKVAHIIACPIVADSFELEGEEYSIVELRPKKFFLTGIAIKDTKIFDKYKINIVAIIRDNHILIPTGDTIIMESDSLVIIGDNESIIDFEALLDN